MRRGRTQALGHLDTATTAELLKNHTHQQIAALYGVTPRTVARHVVRLGLATHPPRYGNDPEWLAKAEALLDEHMSYNEAARTLGCGIGALQRWFPGRGWTPQETAQYCTGTARAYAAIEARYGLRMTT